MAGQARKRPYRALTFAERFLRTQAELRAQDAGFDRRGARFLAFWQWLARERQETAQRTPPQEDAR